MGLPMDAVKHALKRDEKDPSIMDLDPEKSLKSQREEKTEDDDGPPLGEDPEYVKVRLPHMLFTARVVLLALLMRYYSVYSRF